MPCALYRFSHARCSLVALLFSVLHALCLGSYECEVLGGMRELLASGAIASMKLEVFDVLLKLQGCSALQLQRLVSQAGFTLYRISEDATSIPDRSAVVSPETVPSCLGCAVQPLVRPAQSAILP